jgi:hypothetical protein
VHAFLISIFGELIHLQVSEVHLCADLVGFDFSQVNYEERFVTRARKNDSIYSIGVDGVSLDAYRVSTLRFSSHSPLDVQRQMGHMTMNMTNHYASLSVDQLKRSHEMYSPLRAKQGLGTGYWEAE